MGRSRLWKAPIVLTPEIVRRMAARRVVVVGDTLLDRSTDTHAEWPRRDATAPRAGRDGAGPCPAGAANAAANVAGLGASVELVSRVGDDPAGRRLMATLTERGVGLAGMVTVPGWSTPLLDGDRPDGGAPVGWDQGAEATPGAELAGLLDDLGAAADAVIVSDHARGAVTDRVVDAVARLSSSPHGPLVAVDARHLATYHRVRPTVVKASWDEAVALLGPGTVAADISPSTDAVTGHTPAIMDRTGAKIAAVTLDRDGALVLERGRPPHRTCARPAGDDRAIGAGDTFLATLTLGLASGLPTPLAAELAAEAAGAVVQEWAAARCTADALTDALAEVLAGGNGPLTPARPWLGRSDPAT